MDSYDIRLERDGDGWRAHFVTPGGPDVRGRRYAESAEALWSLSHELRRKIYSPKYGSIDAIPRLPEGES